MPIQSQRPKRKSTAPAEGAEKKPRTRVSRACDQCRTAREKCDGIQPVCFTCQASNRQCSYTAKSKKRGIQPGYIRTLELTLSWVFNTFPESEPQLIKILEQEESSSVLFGKDKKSNKLHKRWRRSRFCNDVDRMLSGGGVPVNASQEVSKSSDSESEDSDAGDTVDLLEEAYAQITASSLSPSAAISQNVSEPQFLSPEITSLRGIKLPVEVWHLFDVYFAFSQCWLPISEKPDILKTSYLYTGGLDLSPVMAQAGDHAEMWSILALASLQDTPGRDVGGITGDREYDYPKRFYTIARHLVPSEQGQFELGHVKALLNLAQVNLRRSFPNAALLLVAHAYRILEIFNMKDDSNSSRFRHTYNACFLLDWVLSKQLGCRAYTQAADIEALGEIEPNGLEEWAPWIDPSAPASQTRSPCLALSTFNQLCSLIRIVDGIQGPRNTQRSQLVAYQLNVWRDSLPQTFDYVRKGYSAVPGTPPSFLLLLAYYCCASTLRFNPQQLFEGVVGLIGRAKDKLGFEALPTISQSLLDIYVASDSFQALDQASRIRFQNVRDELSNSWQCLCTFHSVISLPENTSNASEVFPQDAGTAFNIHMPTPESLQAPSQLRPVSTNDNMTSSAEVVARSFQNSATTQLPHQGTILPAPPNFASSQDLESFFDELASLDVGIMDNQPQFMQNLGYAPGSNLEDLLASEFGQFHSLSHGNAAGSLPFT